ncbi:hypothetical protein B4U80_08366 [Leptotrombidium deliense]|uniref:Uncharacterized protein n=1 Tax=Leptotrombidium deliense TaxID=299467 RepID=A0A443SCH1_9ACAR|nr:hypothetical protein B4U80_08366 [Leptotrombidium deliense]
MYSPSEVLNKTELLDFSELDGEMIMTLSLYEIQCPLEPSPGIGASFACDGQLLARTLSQMFLL